MEHRKQLTNRIPLVYRECSLRTFPRGATFLQFLCGLCGNPAANLTQNFHTSPTSTPKPAPTANLPSLSRHHRHCPPTVTPTHNFSHHCTNLMELTQTPGLRTFATRVANF